MAGAFEKDTGVWLCGSCDNVYDSQEEAEECCTRD